MDHQADRRRRAFLAFLAARNLTKGRLTRETGISPNIVYNFLGGKSHYLSQPTLERIAAHYDVPIALLTGETPPPSEGERQAGWLGEGETPAIGAPAGRLASGMVALEMRGVVMGPGIWMETMFSPLPGPSRILLPIPALYAPSAFAVRLADSGATPALPGGSLLGCVAIKDYLQRPATGDQVLAVQRNRVGLFECAVREYRVEGSRHFLVDSAKDHQTALSAPLSDPAALGFQDMFMYAMVLAYAANLPASSR